MQSAVFHLCKTLQPTVSDDTSAKNEHLLLNANYWLSLIMSCNAEMSEGYTFDNGPFSLMLFTITILLRPYCILSAGEHQSSLRSRVFTQNPFSVIT